MAIRVPSPGFIAARRRALAALDEYPDGLTRKYRRLSTINAAAEEYKMADTLRDRLVARR